MPNCTCDHPKLEGESECDECVMKKYDLEVRIGHRNIYWRVVAEALRMAEKAGESTEEE